MVADIYRFTAYKQKGGKGKQYQRGKQEMMKFYGNPVQHIQV
jgi:hypothetical protein